MAMLSAEIITNATGVCQCISGKKNRTKKPENPIEDPGHQVRRRLFERVHFRSDF